jgi:hypothetical protein
MVINRRKLLGLGASLALLGATPLLAENKPPRLLSCRSSGDGRHWLSITDLSGKTLRDIQLPARGHGVCLNHDHTLAAVFARRPGTFVWIVAPGSGEVVRKITAPTGRHYYGHGVFSADSRLLLCSENAYERGDGRIGAYDCHDSFRHIGEFSSGGIGPHEIHLLRDGETLVVANGGILTHPDMPRIKRNLESMRPNLSYLTLNSGNLTDQIEPPAHWHQLSIRHIDVSANDQVAIAMQYQGDSSAQPPLIATHRRGESLHWLSAPTGIQQRMQNYCGSVRFAADGKRFAVSAPRGNLVTYWNAKGDYLGSHRQRDACGIAVNTTGFLVSDGTGSVIQVDQSQQNRTLFQAANSHWDNHMELI